MHGFSGLEELYVAILYCLKLGRLENAWIFRVGREELYVGILYCLMLGRLGNAWIFMVWKDSM